MANDNIDACKAAIKDFETIPDNNELSENGRAQRKSRIGPDIVRFNKLGNDPIVPGVTSAIFLHCGENETLGCIAVPRDDMVKILQLTNGKTSYILIR